MLQRRKTSFESESACSTPSSDEEEEGQEKVGDPTQALIEEAAAFARVSHELQWLKPSANYSISQSDVVSPCKNVNSELISPVEGSVFPWSLLGACSLQSLIAQTLTVPGQSGSSTVEPSEHDLLTGNPIQTGNCACCRCGRLVPHTFPLDPNSSLSHAVCAALVLASNDIRSSTSTASPMASQQPRPNQDTLNATQLFSALIGQRLHPHSASSPNLQEPLRDYSFRDMDRSITDAIVSLMVDDHGCSTSNLRDTTYRVCRWELDLGLPSRPMPGNSAVSYHSSNLIISQVRIFNDSSIALSQNGSLLAALVVPRSSKSPGGLSEKDTFLAVYRLEPRESRGQCIYARRFNASTPVCVDFSPSATCLVVGFATARLFDPQAPAHSSLSKLTPIARIFRLSREREVSQCSTASSSLEIRSRMIELKSIAHPHDHVAVQGRIAGDEEELPLATMKTGSHEAWIRFVLSSPMSVSVNTIVWNPQGGILYGTTKGLLVLMPPGPASMSLDLSGMTVEEMAEMKLEHACAQDLMNTSSRSRKRRAEESSMPQTSVTSN
ncbi:WD domain, G-beta repeat [Cichlidogyrus casuarinus]|uniref:WD domain, G-beta repeat n=1 Tax=Cichlidogyrus casuarinus TaxID=1844966 RepID=A0ABD2QIT5_9PLAT